MVFLKQKIRTIELDGKTVKLQIVRDAMSLAGSIYRSLTYLFYSGILPARNDSEQSHLLTIEEHTVSALSTM